MNISEIITGGLVVAAVILGIILLIKIISAPIKKIFKFVLNMLLGVALMFIINLVGKNFGVSIDLSFTQCAIAALFGVPGVLLLILIKLFL